MSICELENSEAAKEQIVEAIISETFSTMESFETNKAFLNKLFELKESSIVSGIDTKRYHKPSRPQTSSSFRTLTHLNNNNTAINNNGNKNGKRVVKSMRMSSSKLIAKTGNLWENVTHNAEVALTQLRNMQVTAEHQLQHQEEALMKQLQNTLIALQREHNSGICLIDILIL